MFVARSGRCGPSGIQTEGLDGLVFTALGNLGLLQLIRSLEIEPHVRRRSQRLAKPDGAVDSDAAPLFNQIVDAADGQSRGRSQLGLCDAASFQNLCSQNPSRMNAGQPRGAVRTFRGFGERFHGVNVGVRCWMLNGTMAVPPAPSAVTRRLSRRHSSVGL